MLSGTTEAGRHGDGPSSILRTGEVAMIRMEWNFCAAIAAAAALLATGGTAMAGTLGGPLEFLLLPEAGHKGNSHMLMMDKNNLAIADLIIGWIGESVPAR
jgi:hypothetical protein